MKEPRKVVVTRLTEFELARLNSLIEQTGLSKAEILRFALMQFGDKYIQDGELLSDKKDSEWYEKLIHDTSFTKVERIYITHVRQLELLNLLNGDNDTELWREMSNVLGTREILRKSVSDV